MTISIPTGVRISEKNEQEKPGPRFGVKGYGIARGSWAVQRKRREKIQKAGWEGGGGR